MASTEGSVELELDATMIAFEAMPLEGSEGVVALFMSAEHFGDVEVVLIESSGPSLMQQTKWSSGLGRVRALRIVGGDVDVDHAELVIVRDVDPAAIGSWQTERVVLPWSPTLLRAAELDGEGDSELIMASRPVSELAVYGLGNTELMVVELGFEGIRRRCSPRGRGRGVTGAGRRGRSRGLASTAQEVVQGEALARAVNS